MRSGHARLLSEAATTLLNGGLTARRKVAEACFTLAARHGAADMVSGGEKVDDACFLAAVEAKIGVTLLVQCTVNLNAPYSSEFDYFRRFMAVHEQHNRRVLSEIGLAADFLALEVAQSAAPGVATPHLTGSVPATTASARMATGKATKHGSLASHGIVHIGLEVKVPASEFRVMDGLEYTAIVAEMHSDGRTVPQLKTAGPICELRFIEDGKKYWYSVERVTAFAQRSTSPPSPVVAPDSEERQMHTPPERTTSPSSKGRASPVRRRDPRGRSRKLL